MEIQKFLPFFRGSGTKVFSGSEGPKSKLFFSKNQANLNFLKSLERKSLDLGAVYSAGEEALRATVKP